MKATVEIKEVHNIAIDVEVPDDATRDQMIDAAEAKFETGIDDLNMEFDRRLSKDQWTVRNDKGEFIS